MASVIYIELALPVKPNPSNAIRMHKENQLTRLIFAVGQFKRTVTLSHCIYGMTNLKKQAKLFAHLQQRETHISGSVLRETNPKDEKFPSIPKLIISLTLIVLSPEAETIYLSSKSTTFTAAR